MPVCALYLNVGRRPMLIWEKQMNSASAGFMMIRTQSICCGLFRKHWVRFTVHVSLLRRACYWHKLIVMLLCFHRRYIPRGSVSCFVKKNSIAICKKIIHVYRCFDTKLALNNSVYKQQHCIVKTIYRGADNNSLCPFEFCHAWLQKKTAVIFLQAVNWKPIRSEIIFPCDPTKHEPVKINLMKRLRSVSLIKKCKSLKMQVIKAY